MINVFLGKSIYGAEGIVFVPEFEIIPGESQDFGSATSDLNELTIRSIDRQLSFTSGDFPMSEYDGKIAKQPSEKFKVRHDFSPDLETDELILTISSIVIIDLANDTDMSSSMLSDQEGIESDGKRIYYGLKGGVDEGQYKVTIKVATDQSVGSAEGGIREVEHFVSVNER